MKKTFNIWLVLILASLHLSAQVANKTVKIEKYVPAGTMIKFDNIIYDFGIIPYNGDGSHLYVFTNVGSTPLIITNCIRGCGCTNVYWTKTPVLPGQKGMVKATYNTKNIGDFNKGVDVYTNDPQSPKINLRLRGTVEKMPDAPIDTTASKSNTVTASKTVTKW